jgi:hypothetical protein
VGRGVGVAVGVGRGVGRAVGVVVGAAVGDEDGVGHGVGLLEPEALGPGADGDTPAVAAGLALWEQTGVELGEDVRDADAPGPQALSSVVATRIANARRESLPALPTRSPGRVRPIPMCAPPALGVDGHSSRTGGPDRPIVSGSPGRSGLDRGR